MSIWGTTSDWAGKGPHKITHMADERCCQKGEMERVLGKNDQSMSMLDRESGEPFETWLCTECGKIWFRRQGMTGFFMVQPSLDQFR